MCELNRLQCLHVYVLHSHSTDILQSRFIDLYVDFEQDKKTPTRGIHHPSMMDVHTKVLLSVENEIFLLHTNRRSVRIQTTFRPSPKVTLGPGTLLDSIQPRTLCLVPLHLLSGVKCAYITWYCCTILIPYCSEQFHLYTKLKRKSTVQPARETTQITIPI